MNQERDLCTQCLKARAFCYCSTVRAFSSEVQMVILQHPLERKRTVGTARMTHLCIKNSRLIHGSTFTCNPAVKALIADTNNHCVVLYPGTKSMNISSSPHETVRSWFPRDKKLVVFVIDGTWACAKRMIRKSPNLLALPQICFTPKNESEYQFRQQPDTYCLSTIEAVHHILGFLEPSLDASVLLDLFRSMVKTQVKFGGLNKIRRAADRGLAPAT